jgi:hypothetical protein
VTAGPELDPLPLLGALVGHEVDFVMVRGLGGALHGSACVARDLDVACSRTTENRERLAATLRSVHATPPGAPAGLPPSSTPRRSPAGGDRRRARQHVDPDRIARPPDRMKEAAGRPQDKLDAAAHRTLSDADQPSR